MSPLFVAATRLLGLTYSDGLALLYIFACILFCFALHYLIKNMYALLLLYAVLLFNPATMDSYSFQRIYRSALTPAQVLLVFACFFALYLIVGNKQKYGLAWALGAGLSLAFFWYTREDSVWMVPFVLVITVFTVIKAIVRYREDWYTLRLQLVVLCIPFLVFAGVKYTISSINYSYYGIRTTNEINDSSFGDAIKSFYEVKPEQDIKWVTVTRKKLKRIYEISPTMAGIQDIMENCMDFWSKMDRTSGDGEVEDGWFFWALRDAAQQAGYYETATKANEFYHQISVEIQDAIHSGKIEKQKTMPSALMPPFRASSLPEYGQAIIDSCRLLFTFGDTKANLYTTDISGDNLVKVRNFYEMTGSPMLIQIPGKMSVSGWAFSKEDENSLSVALYAADGVKVGDLEWQPSVDVGEYAQENFGISNAAIQNCRFNAVFDVADYGDNLQDYYIGITDGSGEVYRISPDGMVNGSGNVEFSIEEFHFTVSDPAASMSQRYIDRVNVIVSFYQRFNLVVMGLACIAYLMLLIRLINGAIHKNLKYAEWEMFVVPSAPLASLAVLIIGVSYNQTFSCLSVHPLYYSGAYSLILSFEWLAIVFAVNEIISKIKAVRYHNG